MPLIKSGSKTAFKKNVETEMDANPGKSNRAQNLAIAYSVQRRAKSKKMAKGGHVDGGKDCMACGGPCKYALGGAVEGPNHTKKYDRDPGAPASKTDNERLPESSYMAGDMDAPIGSTSRGSHPTRDRSAYMSGEMPDRLALGGAVEGPTHSRPFNENPGTPGKKGDDKRPPSAEYMAGYMDAMADSTPHDDGMRPDEDEYMGERTGGAYARGGQVNPKLQQSHMELDEDRPSSIADAIMDRKQKMAEGGILGLNKDRDILEENSEEEPNHEDQYSYGALRKENYSEHSALDEAGHPRDSNLTGDEREDATHDEHDHISNIRKRMKSKKG